MSEQPACEKLGELGRKVAEAREAFGPIDTAHPFGDFDCNPADAHRCASKVIEVARRSGSADQALAADVLRTVIPRVLEYQRRCLDLHEEAHRQLVKYLDDVDSDFEETDALTETGLGLAMYYLYDALENDKGGVSTEDAMPFLFQAVDGRVSPEQWGPRLAEAILEAIAQQ